MATERWIIQGQRTQRGRGWNYLAKNTGRVLAEGEAIEVVPAEHADALGTERVSRLCPSCVSAEESWMLTICGKCRVVYGHRYCNNCGSSAHRTLIKVVPEARAAEAERQQEEDETQVFHLIADKTRLRAENERLREALEEIAGAGRATSMTALIHRACRALASTGKESDG